MAEIGNSSPAAPAEGQGQAPETTSTSSPEFTGFSREKPPSLAEGKQSMERYGFIFEPEDDDAEDEGGEVVDFSSRRRREEPEAEIEETPDPLAAERERLNAGYEGLQSYLGALQQAVLQQGRILQGYQQVDAELIREAQERERRSSIPDKEEDPEGYYNWNLQQNLRQVASEMEQRQEATRRAEEQRMQAEQAAAAEQYAIGNVREAMTACPELGTALSAYVEQCVDHYQTYYHLDPQQARAAANQAVRQVALQAAWDEQRTGIPPAVALYNYVGADAYYHSPEQSTAAAPSPGAQSFADRRAAAAPPRSAGSQVPATDAEHLQRIVHLAHDGDERAQKALIDHARSLGDLGNKDVREKLMRQLVGKAA